MVRHHRRRNHRLAGFDLPSSVKPMDVAAGALVGLVISAGVKSLLKKSAPDLYSKIPAGLAPAGLGLSSAAVLYYVQKGMNLQRAQGHAIGAGIAGLVVSALDYLKANNPAPTFLDFSAPPVALNLSGYNGLLVDNSAVQSMNGLLVDNAATQAMGNMSMGGDDEMGYSDIVALQA